MGVSSIDGFDPGQLRACREAAGLTQRAVAEQIVLATRLSGAASNLTPAQATRLAREIDTVRVQINDYETGDARPRAPMLHQLASTIGVDVLELLSPSTPVDLAVLRVRRGMRQSDVVEQGLGITKAYLGRIERGAARPTDDQRRKLAEILQVDAADLDAAIEGTRTASEVLAR